jgi:hypothetical protein
MTKPFEERNQTDTARRKLKSLAAASGIDMALVSALANFSWDYDPDLRGEALGWVDNKALSTAACDQLMWIAELLGLRPDFRLEHAQAASELIQAHCNLSSTAVWNNFIDAALTKNYSQVSEFASHNYLRGIDDSKVMVLAWERDSLSLVEIARHLFFKFFRGGAVRRYDLGYLWCDLTIPLDYAHPDPLKGTPWIEALLASIGALPPHSTLKDLVRCCKGLVSGDNWFKQEVLQALSYADVLRVTGLPVTNMFIAERRNELSPHFYSNEWSFPLNFWSTKGGAVNLAALPTLKKA